MNKTFKLKSKDVMTPDGICGERFGNMICDKKPLHKGLHDDSTRIPTADENVETALNQLLIDLEDFITVYGSSADPSVSTIEWQRVIKAFSVFKIARGDHG